jgi:eukaryotic-like serine/threonine-protein kinase
MVWDKGKQLKNGRYTIDRPLRQGRLSTTYLATSKKGPLVVIKVTNDQAIDPAKFKKLKEHFRDEAFRLAKCSSPGHENNHIVKVEESFEEDDLVCIPMEFISGTTLAEQNPRKLPEAEALHYIRQIGSALEVLHGQGLIHRDVSPENIMLRSRAGVNEAVLIDFGLVRDWETGTMTMMSSDITAFTAPELCDPGEKRGWFTDLYGLGAVLFTLVKGEDPPKAGNRRANDRLPFPVGIHPEIATAIEKAMEFEGGDRSASLVEWLNMLPDIPLPALQPVINQTTLTPEENRKRQFEIVGMVMGILTVIFTAFQGIPAFLSYFYPKDTSPPVQSPVQSSPIAKPPK